MTKKSSLGTFLWITRLEVLPLFLKRLQVLTATS